MDSTTVSTTITNETANLIATMTEYLKGSVEFVKEQAPDVIQQLLAWKMAELWVLLILFATFTIVSPIAVRYCWKRADCYDNEGWIVGAVISAIGELFSIPLFIMSLLDLLKLYIAPKVFLLEYLAKLVN